jgi:hypothetical protein
MRKRVIVLLCLAGTAVTSSSFAQDFRGARLGLPFPPRGDKTLEAVIPGGDPLRADPLPRFDPSQTMEQIRTTRSAIRARIKALEGALAQFDIESLCGLQDESQHIEEYDGTLGPSRAFVNVEQSSTAQIQWTDLSAISADPNIDLGNVRDVRWCSGTLIREDLFLTAGHCVMAHTGEIPDDPWRTPSRREGGSIRWLTPRELAPLMQVNFNYQKNGQTGELRTPDTYPVAALVEYGSDPGRGDLDYAIIRLGPGPDGKQPSSRYRIQNFDVSARALEDASNLTIIQHPQGQPKLIEAGPQRRNSNAPSYEIHYGSLDTQGGASGSGIIDQSGRLIGVHTNGGCTATGGTNRGVALNAISAVSDVVR